MDTLLSPLLSNQHCYKNAYKVDLSAIEANNNVSTFTEVLRRFFSTVSIQLDINHQLEKVQPSAEVPKWAAPDAKAFLPPK